MRERVVSTSPSTHDGRNIDEETGALSGEGGTIEVDSPEEAFPARRSVFDSIPSAGEIEEPTPTYYGLPVVKKSVWEWYVPAYLYVGGAAGAAAALGGIAQVLDRRGHDGLIRRCRALATAGVAVGTGLLIADLGRPARFLHFLRVFRPTSVINMGTWLLVAGGAASSTSLVLGGRRGALGRLGEAAGVVGGLFGLPIATYSALLLSNTATPVWASCRRTLPFAFAGGAMSSAAALLDLMDLSPRERRTTRALGVAGRALDLVGGALVEREAGRVAVVARPLKRGRSGALWKAGKALTGASLVVSLLPGLSKRARTAAAVLGTAGALAMRFGIAEAGKASADDPQATFRAQREGLGAAEVLGRAGVTGPNGRRALDEAAATDGLRLGEAESRQPA